MPEIIGLARALPELTVSIAGDGPLREVVAAAAAAIPNLHYLGWVTREALAERIDEHDLVLLPSRVESFGTVALEGMARGRPVVVSATCGIADWPELMPGLFPIAADETLVQAVQRIRKLPESVRLETGERARRAALELNDRNVRDWIERLSQRPKRSRPA